MSLLSFAREKNLNKIYHTLINKFKFTRMENFELMHLTIKYKEL